ncbi:short-chain dehydrogenase/reductase SDR [Deferribacter desulfuricans SSM1]|uniref:Short-chain dehydrogenase/reductase SDR n=1 Tax=Deferribacter desulfuricans (strain DSM 14783 / JCM 11476 / NBRC 101012 / SSM1) TaxID=639282 RepID=D3PDW4_DEFDS|nr:short-chain dehydrogenase/reductase SDR [Deferribacter desulfuricans SSM1]
MGRKVLITGASKGIGLSLAKLLLKKGDTLVLTARTMESSPHLKELEEISNNFYTINADLSKAEDIEKVYNFTKEKIGSIDILVNNAGRGIYAPLGTETAKSIKEILDLNVFAPIYLTNLFAEDLVANKGTIVNIASVAGRKGFAGLSTYCASKWAVVGFAESVRDELHSKGVRVITIEPGLVDTEWGENLPEQFINYKKSVDMLTPDDVANLIAYAVDAPSHVSLNEVLIRPTNQPR